MPVAPSDLPEHFALPPLPAPVDADFAARVRESFARQGAMATLGARLLSVEPGRVLIALPTGPHLSQQHGFVHAGIVTTAVDSACGYAAATLMPADAGVLTVEFKVNLMAPARGPLLHCEGRVTKAGRTLSFAEGRVWQHGADGRVQLVATMSATLMILSGRAGVQG